LGNFDKALEVSQIITKTLDNVLPGYSVEKGQHYLEQSKIFTHLKEQTLAEHCEEIALKNFTICGLDFIIGPNMRKVKY